MFPPCALVLFYFVLFLLCFPLGKFPLPLFALEKGLYLREQNTGQGVHFMVVSTVLRKLVCSPWHE